MVYTIVAVLAGLENIFPPVPADTAIALGAFLSHRGTVSAGVVFGLTWSVNVGTAALVYGAARTAGRRFFRGRLGRRLIRPSAMQRIETLYARHGVWGIFLSRFIPGVRAVVPPFAGVAGLGAVRALVPTAAASALWYGALTWLVASVARQLEDVVRLMDRLNLIALVGAVLLVAAIVGIILLRRRKAASPTDA